MTAIVDRCHACGTRRAGIEQVCGKCGSGPPALPEKLETPPEPADGLAWSHRIPIVNNRYVWIRWGWAAFAFAAGFAIVLGTLIVVAFGSTSGGAGFAVKLYAAIAIIAVLVVIGCGLFAAAAAGNGVTARFTLSPQGAAVATSGGGPDSAGSAILAFGGSLKQARDMSLAAALLLPQSGEAKWADVRRAQFDASRRVITLRRRWHHPLRIYVPPERFDEAVAFVREHAPASR